MRQLVYVHDPMCSWCWGFDRTRRQLLAALPEDIVVKRLLGGLAADSDEPMPQALRQQISDTWRRIEQKIPGISFNFDFWRQCTPVRSTWPACRAVIAARLQGEMNDELMTQAIQSAYYTQALNPSETATLTGLAAAVGLDVRRFANDLGSPAVELQLQQELEQARRLGVSSFPSLVLLVGGSGWPIPVDYIDYHSMLATIELVSS